MARSARKRFLGKPEHLKGHFDEAFYLKTYPEVAQREMDPLVHYWNEGWIKGFDPSPDFSTSFYLATYPDVANSEFNPFWHYIRIGRKEGRVGRPRADAKASAAGRPATGAVSALAPLKAVPAGAGSSATAPQAASAKGIRRRGKPEDLEDDFDRDFYLKSYPEVAESGMDPLTHYWTTGWAKGFDPSPDFSTAFYLAAHPDVANSEFNPFWHYIRIGRKEGRVGRPRADAKAPASAPAPPKAAPAGADGATPQAASAKGIRRRGKPEDLKGHFDADFYLKSYPEVAESGMDPLTHYWTKGWAKGYDPSPDFSTTFYVNEHRDLAKSEFNPFWHYIKIGKGEGRPARPKSPPRKTAPAPQEAPAAPPMPHVEVTSVSGNIHDLKDHFDADFYLKTYPEVAESGMDPLTHYWTKGWVEGRDPNADFSTAYYLKTNQDVARNNVHPFWHYVVAGQREGRPGKAPLPQPATPSADSLIEAIRPHFDAVFYTARYRDVAASGIDPLTHYWKKGWHEGRDPAPDFSTRFYLEHNSDVAAAKVNPFWHYVVKGKAEGRPPRHPGGHRVDRLRTNEPLEKKVRAWKKSQPIGELLGDDKVLGRIAHAVSGARRLIISVGHDRYWIHSGGVQLCIHREETLAAQEGSCYLYIHPVQALPRLAHRDEDDDLPVGMVVNGTPIGACRISALIAAVATVRDDLSEAQVVIHHMLGHLPERIAELIKAAGRNECFLWLHDFFAVCPSYTLQRNDIAYCAAPRISSNACTLCTYGRERRLHLERMAAFFGTIDVHLLSPSEVALKVFEKTATVIPATTRVVSHMTLDYVARGTPAPKDETPLTIGFLGTPAAHKGWEAFEALTRRHRGKGYRFVFCGSADVPSSGIDHVPVHVTAQHREAMIEAVAREKIDFVLHFASWPETFSLSTFEALAGGAYVLTNPLSGNVAAAVRTFKRGAVLEDEADLHAFFEDGRAETMLAAVREARSTRRVAHTLSRMTYELLLPVTTREEAPL